MYGLLGENTAAKKLELYYYIYIYIYYRVTQFLKRGVKKSAWAKIVLK